MPQAIAAVLVNVVGWTATAAAVAGYAISFVATLALSSYQKRKGERAARAQYDAAQVDRLVNMPATVAPRELVLGRVRKGGNVFFRGAEGTFLNTGFSMCITLAAHEIDGVEQVYFNDVPVSINPDGYVSTRPYGGRFVIESVTIPVTSQVVTLDQDPAMPGNGWSDVVNSQPYNPPIAIRAAGRATTRDPVTGLYHRSQTPIPVTVVGRVVTLESYDPTFQYSLTYEYRRELSLARVFVHLGGADQAADPVLQGAFPAGFWTAQHRAQGVAYLVVQLLYDENAFQSGIPNVTARIRGAKCYDPRTGQTVFTENPALMARHVLTHPQFGKRTSLTAAEDARIIAAANVNETAINYGAGVVAMYRAGLVVPFGAPARDVLDDLSQAMGGMWGYAGGELFLRAGVWQAPVMHLSEDDLAVVQRGNDGAVNQQAMTINVHRARNEKINTIVSRIWDESANYVQTPMPPYRAEALIAADGMELSQEVVMPAVFFWPQAHFIAQIMLRDSRDPMMAVLPFKLKAYPLELFDSITISMRRYGWVNKEFIVLGRTFDPQGYVSLTLKETSAAIYAPGAAIIPEGYADNSQLPKPWDIRPPAITKIESGESVLVVQSDGTIINGVRVTWAPIADPAITNGGTIDVQYRVIPDGPWQEVAVDGASPDALLTGFGDLAWIVIRARSRNRIAVSDWGPQQTHQVIGKSAPPPDIEGLSISGSVLSWVLPYRPPDLAGYVFRFHYGNNTDWHSAAPLHTGVLTESPYDLVTRPGGVVTVMGKAIDTSEILSNQAAVIVMNLGDPPIANVLEEWDFHALGWPFEPGEQSAWTLIGGMPTAEALDSFYAEDAQSFYGADADSLYSDESYAELVYVTNSISANSALAGSVMTVEVASLGGALRIDYRLSGPGSFYGDDGQSFYGPDAEPFYGPPGEWQPWPGQIIAANDAYQFRVTLGSGAVRSVLQELLITIDAPDIVEEIADLVVSSTGTEVPYLSQFTAIKTVQATLQSNGSGAITVEINKSNPLAPVVRAFNASHVAVSGATADITLKGY